MKKMTFVLLAAAVVSFGAPSAEARRTAPSRGAAAQPAVPAYLTALLRANPTGGAALSDAIADVLTNDSSAAASVIGLAKMANPDQKAAIAAGYVKAIIALQTTNPSAARILTASLDGADDVFRAMIAVLQSQNYAEAGGSPGGHGGTVFSPGGGGFSSGGARGGIFSPGGVGAVNVSPN
jgi:hypothetical protein